VELRPLVPSVAIGVKSLTVTGPVIVEEVGVYNSNAAARFVLAFNAAALPADGTVPVAPPIPIPAGAFVAFEWPGGRQFPLGCCVALSTTDTTLTIVGANDASIEIDFLTKG
jgi:hypothetical protein